MFSSFPVEYTSTPIYRDGQLAGVVVSFKEFAQRKSAERELLEAYAEVARMKEQLEAENIYLQERDQCPRDSGNQSGFEGRRRSKAVARGSLLSSQRVSGRGRATEGTHQRYSFTRRTFCCPDMQTHLNLMDEVINESLIPDL